MPKKLSFSKQQGSGIMDYFRSNTPKKLEQRKALESIEANLRTYNDNNKCLSTPAYFAVQKCEQPNYLMRPRYCNNQRIPIANNSRVCQLTETEFEKLDSYIQDKLDPSNLDPIRQQISQLLNSMREFDMELLQNKLPDIEIQNALAQFLQNKNQIFADLNKQFLIYVPEGVEELRTPKGVRFRRTPAEIVLFSGKTYTDLSGNDLSSITPEQPVPKINPNYPFKNIISASSLSPSEQQELQFLVQKYQTSIVNEFERENTDFDALYQSIQSKAAPKEPYDPTKGPEPYVSDNTPNSSWENFYNRMNYRITDWLYGRGGGHKKSRRRRVKTRRNHKAVTRGRSRSAK